MRRSSVPGQLTREAIHRLREIPPEGVMASRRTRHAIVSISRFQERDQPRRSLLIYLQGCINDLFERSWRQMLPPVRG
ncbi:MAG: hypothetical protein HQL56_15370 [Magnetococcales bacterium]|nr:hypothetical protein [Magnetococcales bacterium]